MTLTDENVPLEGIGLPDKLLEISGDPVPLEQLPPDRDAVVARAVAVLRRHGIFRPGPGQISEGKILQRQEEMICQEPGD